MMNPGISILPLAEQPQHLETIAAWVHADRKHAHPHETLASTIQALRGRLNTGQIPLTLVALSGEQLAGTVSLVLDDAPPGFSSLSPWLASLLVAVPFQGQGLDVALTTRAFAEARKLGYSGIYAWTDNEKDWYLQRGWTVAGTTIFGRRYVGVMRYDLSE